MGFFINKGFIVIWLIFLVVLGIRMVDYYRYVFIYLIKNDFFSRGIKSFIIGDNEQVSCVEQFFQLFGVFCVGEGICFVLVYNFVIGYCEEFQEIM